MEVLSTARLWEVALAVLLLNIPFGFWRAGVRKFTLPWFLVVHLPVPAVVTLRILTGLGWAVQVFAVLIGAFFLGQLLGGRIRQVRKQAEEGA